MKKKDMDDAAKIESTPDQSGRSTVRPPPPPGCVGYVRFMWQSCIAGIRRTPLPHRTVLPMLQFSLAGVIGKPDTFFNVPAVRFTFEFLQFL